MKLKNKNVKELKGRGVTSGKVKGRAKVCQGMLEALQKIKKGDIIVKVAGKDIENGMDLRIALINHFNGQADKPVEIDLLRIDGANIQPIKIFVTLEEEKEDEDNDD